MDNWIEHIREPRKLYLAWQAPDHMKDRFRWAVATLESRGANEECVLRYLQAGQSFERLNQGRSFEGLLSLGYQGYPAFNRKRETHEIGVLEVFMRRMPPRSRPDFRVFKQQFRLPPQIEISDFALLGVTEAKLPSDGFSIVDPLDADADRCDLMLEVAGYRYYAKGLLPDVWVGQPVEISAEPENEHDANAVRVNIRNVTMGYINRLQAATFLRWLSVRRVSGAIERLNGNPEKPRAFIFVRIRPLSVEAAA